MPHGWLTGSGRRWTCAAALLILLSLLVVPTARATTMTPAADDEQLKQQLVQRYSPILVVREHATQCGDGEPYLPMDVDRLFGRSDVVLHTPGGSIKAPTQRQVAAATDAAYLDYPGDPLDPGCGYERWYDKIRAGSQPTIYGRVVQDLDSVVVQYYFFYAFNDWNDLHEGDWEMMQVQIDADNLTDALATDPTSTAYAQHEGAETADWVDVFKLWLVDDTHPVLYPGQGSHASYYTQAVWLGRSAATGFGCDNTAAPGTEIRPLVELLPTDPPDSVDAPYAWLRFTGHWGQKEAGFNNGPTGPFTKTQWSLPVLWAEVEGRPSAIALPPTPSAATRGFCTMVTGGSKLLVTVLDKPWLSAGVAVLVLVLLAFFVRRTRWRGGTSAVVDRQRRTGQILVSMIGVARRLSRPLIVVSALLVGAVTLAGWVGSRATRNEPDYGNITNVNAAIGGLWPFVLAVLSWVVLYFVQAVCVAVILELVQQLAEQRPVRLREAVGNVRHHRTPVYTYLAAAALITLTFSSFWLIPVSLILLSIWSVSFVAAGVEDLPLRRALARSRELTSRRRLKSTLLALTLLFVSGVSGPILAGVLVLATDWPVWVDDLCSAVVTAIVVPAAIVGMTLLFFDLRHQATAGEPVATAPDPQGADPAPV